LMRKKLFANLIKILHILLFIHALEQNRPETIKR
jgi:hypothetical protein